GGAAIEEVVAGGAEALPDVVGLLLWDRADRLPLLLELLDRLAGLLPLRRLLERLDLDAELFLLRQVRAPLFVKLAEVLLRLLVDQIRRGLEARPQRLVLLLRRRARRLPTRLQILQQRGGATLVLDLVQHGGERLGFLAELLELGDAREAFPAVRLAELAELDGELLDAGADAGLEPLVSGPAEERLGAAQRRLGSLDVGLLGAAFELGRRLLQLGAR